MIELQNISKIYRGEGVKTLALTDLNLTVNDGDFVAVMGPSGCGKTSLLNIMGLVDTIDEGKLLFDGVDVSRCSETERMKLRRGRIGFVFQSFNLIDELTVAQNIELPMKYMSVRRRERSARVENVMKLLKINHRADFYPHSLSGGQQQTVAIARAIVSQPRVILADEPTGNLDTATGKMIMEILTELNHSMGTTIVMATHSRRDAEYAHRVVNMCDGTIVTTEDLI